MNCAGGRKVLNENKLNTLKMGLFTKKIKEITPLEMLDAIDKSVNDMAGVIVSSGDKKVQMIHMSGIEQEENDGKGRCLAVIGNPQGLIDMLYSASMKEKNFARILFSAAHLLSSKSEDMAKLRTEVAIEIEGPCTCPACQAEARGEVDLGQGVGIKIGDIEKMTPEQMDELVKGIVSNSIDKAKRG